MLGVGAVPSKVKLVTIGYTKGVKPFQLPSRYLHNNTNDSAEIARGIPSEVAALECPDAELKRSTLNEFQLLDDRFQATLEQWEEQHRSVLRCIL